MVLQRDGLQQNWKTYLPDVTDCGRDREMVSCPICCFGLPDAALVTCIANHCRWMKVAT
jgi:hypothetical protein